MHRRYVSLFRRAAAVFGGALLLTGCAFSDEALLPSLTGEDPAGQQAQAQPVQVQPQPVAPGAVLPGLGTTSFETPGVTAGTPSGTHVGQKIDELRDDLGRLQSRMGEHNDQLQAHRSAARQSAGAYHGLVGAMNSRLQVGTTPGNPELVAQWNQAQIELNKVEDNGGSCLASFVVRNRLGHTLDRFSMDLYVFDSDGVIARQVLLDLAPLRGNKTTVLSFFLIERPCGEISRILINDIPSCRSEGTGETLDCLDGLSVSSRSPIEMVK